MKKLKQIILNRFLWRNVPPEDFARRLNLLAKFKSRDLKVFWDAESETYGVVQNGEPAIFLSRAVRVRDKYFATRDRLDDICNRYLINRVDFSSNDILVDVGANVGELSIALFRRHGVIPICCEPDPVEIRALRKNLQAIQSLIITNPLWSDVAVKEFYLNNDRGDSSLLPQKQNGPKVDLTTTTLNEVGEKIKNRFGRSGIRLLKLEAEGSEPEILAGGNEFLNHVDFISADLGPERGHNKDNTVPECVNYLTERGFRIKHVVPDKSIYLFGRE